MDINVPPFFSIVIPTFNRSQFVLEAIESVLTQDYRSYEIIVVDDGSTDDTEGLVTRLYPNAVRYFKTPNNERGSARNFGSLRSVGQYITFLDSDDVVYPHFLRTAEAWITKSHFPEFCHLAYEIEEPGAKRKRQMVFKGDVNKIMITGNPLSCIGVFLRHDIAVTYLFAEERELAGSEDWVLWLQLAARYRIYHCPKVSACIRHHEQRSVLNFEPQKLIDRIRLAEEKVMQDKVVMQRFPNSQSKISANLAMYLSLHLVICGDTKNGMKFFVQAIWLRPFIGFSLKGIALVRKLIQSWWFK